MDSAVANAHQKPLQRPNENINGPRVSFNKDVHVKRIGGRSNDSNDSYVLNGGDHLHLPPPPPAQLQYKRELPRDLTKEELIKEAERVIAQTERIKCSVDTPNSLAGIRLQDKLPEDRKFSSLPHRKKKSKPLSRSVSDASQKKPKRTSIFSLFSKRSDPNLNTVDATDSPRSGKRTGKPVGRSKSDVGYNSSHLPDINAQYKTQTVDRKRIKIPDSDELMAKTKKKSQLSPIIENPSSKQFFGFTPDEKKLLRFTKSEEKSFGAPESMQSDELSHPIKITSVTNPKHTRSLESLHSSQLPQERLPLTKGLKVDGMVKRLSMDRFSPPLHFNSPAFSYTRPTDSIVYAQVRRDENAEKSKIDQNDLPSTIHRSTGSNARERSPCRNIFGSDSVDHADHTLSPVRQTLSTKFLNEKNKEMQSNNQYRNASPLHNGDRFATEFINRPSYDETPGFEETRRIIQDQLTPTRDISRQSSSEPPIIPTMRPSYGSIERLASRRKLLESKIQDRTFGRSPTRTKLLTNQNQSPPVKAEPKVNGVTYEHRSPEHQVVPPPRKQWAKQPKYYPETNLSDEFCSDIDSLRREQERQRHKFYLDRKLQDKKPASRFIDLGYIDHIDRHMDKAPTRFDSGNEFDFKRNRPLLNENGSRYRSADNMKNITELFLKRECQFSEALHPSKKRYDFVFRERSIDDGSHFDPRLDKYPNHSSSQGTLTRKSVEKEKKSDKKFGSLKRMKELFSIGSKKKSQSPPSSKSEISYKDRDVETFDPVQHQHAIDIATRRRLSTPKASIVPKRFPSQKSSKSSHVSSRSEVSTKPAPKTSWFKSLDRLTRKKTSDPKKPSSIKRSNTTLSRPTYQRAQSPSPDFRPANQQNLRFFGDTDLESMSKSATTNRKRPQINANNSQSLQNLQNVRPSRVATRNIETTTNNVRGATSMQNINKDIRSKYVPEFSESTSENENMNSDRKPYHAVRISHSTPNSKHKSRRQYQSMEYLERDRSNDPNRSENNSQRSSRPRTRDIEHEHSLYNERTAEELHRSALRERNGRSTSETRHLPPKGPTKPARELDRRRALSNERFLESSGTEGESSQQSVVYLHATTIGHIPQPYVASSRRSSKSRDELSSIKSKSSSPMQPMTKTVSRSVSMSAPWTPRHFSDGYEINYSQTMQNPKKKTASTLNRDGRSNVHRSKDDITSLRSYPQKTSTLPKNRK